MTYTVCNPLYIIDRYSVNLLLINSAFNNLTHVYYYYSGCLGVLDNLLITTFHEILAMYVLFSIATFPSSYYKKKKPDEESCLESY